MSDEDEFHFEFNKLGILCIKIRGGMGFQIDSPIVVEYNTMLEEIIDKGLREPLDLEIEISDNLLSKRYLSFCKPLSSWRENDQKWEDCFEN